MDLDDAYQLLGVDKDDDMSIIIKAYRKEALKVHPDKNKEKKESERKFKQLNEALTLIKDHRNEEKDLSLVTMSSVDLWVEQSMRYVDEQKKKRKLSPLKKIDQIGEEINNKASDSKSQKIAYLLYVHRRLSDFRHKDDKFDVQSIEMVQDNISNRDYYRISLWVAQHQNPALFADKTQKITHSLLQILASHGSAFKMNLRATMDVKRSNVVVEMPIKISDLSLDQLIDESVNEFYAIQNDFHNPNSNYIELSIWTSAIQNQKTSEEAEYEINCNAELG